MESIINAVIKRFSKLNPNGFVGGSDFFENGLRLFHKLMEN